MVAIIVLIVIVVLFFIYLFFDISYNKFQDYILRINDVELKINNILDNKYDNIIKINNIIKKKIKTEKEIIDDISNLKEENKTSLEIDNILNESFNKIDYIKNQYKELEDEKELKEIYSNIKKEDESLKAYKKYYNDNSNDYNRLTNLFPYILIAKILGYKEKILFND